MCNNKQTLCQPPLCPLTCPEHNKSLSPDTYTEPTSNLCPPSAPLLTIYQTPTPHSSPPRGHSWSDGWSSCFLMSCISPHTTPPPRVSLSFYRFHNPLSTFFPSYLLLLCPLQDRQFKDPLKMSTCMDEHADGGDFPSVLLPY